MDRGDRDTVLCWTLDAIDGEVDAPPALPTDRLLRALLSTELAALVSLLAERHSITFDGDVAEELLEHRRSVATRHQRHLALAPDVFDALGAAGIIPTPVTGIVLTSLGVWPWRSARPMAAIDVVVREQQVELAAEVLERTRSAGAVRPNRTNVTVAIDDCTVVVHAGWSEVLQAYDVVRHDLLRHTTPAMFLGSAVHQLSPPWLVAHVIGRLSADVVRRQVRAVDVVDAVLGLRWLDRADQPTMIAALRSLDPRLAEPGLWLVDHYSSSDLDRIGLLPDLRRLGPEAAGWLRRSQPHDVLVDPAETTPWSWRSAFARPNPQRQPEPTPDRETQGPGFTRRLARSLGRSRAG